MSRSIVSTSSRRRLFLLVPAMVGLSLLSCGREVTGPEGGMRTAAFALAPEMPTAFAVEGSGDVVPFDRVRITLERLGELVLERVVDFPSTSESVELSLEVLLPFGTDEDGIDLSLNMQYINAAGDTVFRAGPQTVTARPASAGTPTPVVPVTVTYVGTGSDAAFMDMAPGAGTVVAGTTTQFSATAYASNESVIPNTPFVFSSPDAAHVTITPQGLATWLANRGTARIIATLPTGQLADTVTMTVALPATQLVLVSGGGQNAAAGAALEEPVVLRVTASDAVPVAGVTVTFTVATGGGVVEPVSAVSDVDGLVQTSWTLGTVLGAQTITATFPGLVGGPLTVGASAGVGAAVDLVYVSGNEQSGVVSQPLAAPLVVRAVDALGNGVAGVTVDFSAGQSGGSMNPAQMVTDANGLASTLWTLGATPGSHDASAYAPSLDAVVSFIATAGTGTGGGLVLWTGAVSNDWSVAGNWSTGVVPTFSDSAVIPAVATQPVLTAETTVLGAVEIQAGTLWMNGHQLATVGDFVTSGSGVLVMQDPNDILSVGGDAVFSGGNESGLITEGVMSVGGNFTQVGTNSTASFQAGPNHTTVLQAMSLVVAFENPGTLLGESRFGELAWTGTGTLTQQSGITVTGLYVTTATDPVTHLGIGGTQGRYLEFGTRLAGGPTIFDNVRVLVRQVGDASPVTLTNLTFRNLPTTAVQLTVAHPGGQPVDIENVVFETTPTTGGLYLSALDNTPAPDVLELVVDVSNPTPVTPGGFIQVSGGAVINWPASSERTWIGVTSTDWGTASNWSPAAVPGALDDVLIAGGFPNMPTLSTAATIRNLTVATGSTLTLAGSILTVDGDIEVDGAVVADPALTGFRANGIGRTIRGTGIEHVDVRGSYSLSGALTVTTDIYVRGSLNANGFALNTTDLITLSAGVFVMQDPNAVVTVTGQAMFTGGNTHGLLTDGVLRVGGRLVSNTNGTGNPPNAFSPTGGHTVQLFGGGIIDIDILNLGGVGFNTSYIQNLDISQHTGTVNFVRANNNYIAGQLRSHPSGTAPTLASPAAVTLQVASVSVSGLVVEDVPIIIGEGVLEQFDNVRFTGFPALSQALGITNAGNGGPFTMNGLIFETVPSGTGARYLLANDADGPTGPNPLVINVNDADPASPGGLVDAVNGAVINWPMTAPVRAWTGAVSTDWATPGNWLGGVVPGATDSAYIAAGTPNAPVMAQLDSVRTLALQAGATLSLDADLWVHGSVDVPATAVITSTGGRLMLSNPSGGTLSGAVPTTWVRGGLFVLDGSTTVSGDLQTYGDQFGGPTYVEGDLSVGAHDLTISGGIFTGLQGTFTMTGTGTVNVGTYVNFLGNSTAGKLTNGILRVAGQVYQDGTDSPTSFLTSGTHVLELVGDGSIFFTDPAQSTLANVEFVTPGMTRTLGTDMHVTGLVSVQGANISLVSDEPLPAGNSRRIHAGRVETFGVNTTFSNIAFTTGAFTSNFGGGVTFSGFDPAIVQLDIQGSTNALNSALNNTSFTTTPTGAGRWVRIVDTNGATDGSPTLTVTNPTPTYHGGWAEALAPATMTGWQAGPSFRWTGAVNTSWTEAGNWSDNIVPGPADSVHITDGFTNQPDFPGQVTLRALVHDATIITNLAGELTITERLVTNSNMDCDGGEIILAGGATPVRFSGAIACSSVLISSGTAVPDGRVTVNSDLMVWGEDALLVLGRNTVVAPFFSTIGLGRLSMTEPTDSLITQAATFGGGSTSGLLTDGVLVVTGNFSQQSEVSGESFAASGNHTTVFAGLGNNQQASFATPGEDAGTSHFANVEMSKGEPGTHLQLNQATFAVGVLRTGAGAPAQQLFQPVNEPRNGSVLFQSRGADVDQISFSNVKWSILDGSPIGRMDNITFAAMDSASTQLNIERSGGATVGIRNIAFGATLEEGFYLRLVDLDGDVDGFFTVTVDGVTPGVRQEQYIVLINGAILTGWPVG